MSRHVFTTVAVAALSLAVLSSPVQAQDEPPPARTTEDLLAAIEAVRAKLRALDEPVDIRTSTEQEFADLRDRAEAGDTEAQVRLLALYAEQGNAQAQFGVGIGYSNGFGVPLDYSKAAAWYRRAAEQGHADAQVSIGSVYLTGQGVKQDSVEAVAWFRRAAEQGHAGGQLMLGLGYATGEGVPQDYSEAAAWYRKAAEQNEATAQYKLGQTYHHGLGVPQDYAEAITWYRQAAEQGNADAQGNLGLMYAKGEGVPQDNVEAHMWFNLAASRLTGEHRERTVAVRDDLAARMTPADLSEAQRLAREWDAAGGGP